MQACECAAEVVGVGEYEGSGEGGVERADEHRVVQAALVGVQVLVVGRGVEAGGGAAPAQGFGRGVVGVEDQGRG